jgi:hypothetical protein
MQSDSRSDDELIRDLGEALTTSLWLMARKEPEPFDLIFPSKRDGTRRVSEQESKVIVTQWLKDEGYIYSIETPTKEAYIQKGKTPESALTDVTVYGRDGSKERRLNIELKAHQPPWESFRKDLEKLVIENVPGMWFHTLEKADQRSWDAIAEKMRKSFTSLQETGRWAEALEKGRQSVTFVFCVLEPEEVRSFEIWFDGWEDCLGSGFPKGG